MKNPAAKIAKLRGLVADQIEELSAVIMHLREAAEHANRNPLGAAQDLADAGTVLIELHDSCGNLSKAAFELKTALSK